MTKVGVGLHFSSQLNMPCFGFYPSFDLNISHFGFYSSPDLNTSHFGPHPNPFPDISTFGPHPNPFPDISTFGPHPNPFPDISTFGPHPNPFPDISTFGPHPNPLLEGEGIKKGFCDFSEYQWIDRDIICNAKKLRREQTTSEDYFWSVVRNRQFAGLKFRRQHPVGRSIVDFFCQELLLVVELDGSVHDLLSQRVEDRVRQYDLELQGYIVLRFSNKKILSNIEGVFRDIISHPQLAPLLMSVRSRKKK